MSRAADELWISQSALSKAISNLEDELGFKLFNRVGRGISLNDSGRVFYHNVSRVLILLDDAIRQAELVQRKKTCDVSVLFTAATFIAARIREEFEQQYPEISLEIKCCYTADDKDLTDCDFHIYATPEEVQDMTCIKLLDEEMCLACGKKHPLARAAEINLADTEEYLYQCLPPQESMHENFASACRAAGFEPKIGFCTEDSYAFFGGLSSSTLLTMVPSLTAFSALDKDLVLKKIKTPECRRTIYIAYRSEKELSSQCKIFKGFCEEFFKKLEEHDTEQNASDSCTESAKAEN